MNGGLVHQAVSTLRAHAVACSHIFLHTFMYSHLHQSEVATHAVCLGVEYGLESMDIEILKVAADLHDTGKMALLDTLRACEHIKIERDSAEFKIIMTHSELGARGIEAMAMARPMLSDTFYAVARIVRHHHEAWDGSGYPAGLKGKQIPLLARMLTVVDSSKAMTTPERTWRKPLSVPEMINELNRCAGSQFDPELVDTYCRIIANNRIRYPSTVKSLRATGYNLFKDEDDII